MKPDFSGEFVLNRLASRLSAAASAIDGATLRIEHREPTFRCTGTFVAGDKTVQEFSFEIPSAWDGDTLVNRFAEAAFEMTWRYELLDDGRRLRASEQLKGSGRDQDNVWEFERSSIS